MSLDTDTDINLEYPLAEKAALRLIARAEQNSAGLTRKLEKRKFSPASISMAVSRLTELKLVDDERYARLWLESHLRLARSPLRLLSSLCGRGIDRDAAEAALKTVLDEETELAMLERFIRHHSKKNAGNRSERNSSLKYLLKQEGFSFKVLQQFLENDHIHFK